jgi:Staygreen protein
MSRLKPEKLKVIYKGNVTETNPITPRRYTLTHSDTTGDLTLTIGSEYDRRQISGWYTRLMRDEVLAEWIKSDESYSLDVYCHVGGGLIFGGSSMRESIFLNEMPLVLEALRFGDRLLFDNYAELDETVIRIHLQTSGRDYRVVDMGSPRDYILKT